MDVRCEKCSTEYEFDENRVGENGVTVKCTACGYVFKVKRPRRTPIPRSTTSLGKGPQGREWLVRRPDAQMIAFRELTTLQKWIVEGRIARDDEISKNGETWKRLGNILELEPFFSVYEKARALNDLIERGAIEGKPIELRGSEVLATMSPVSSIPLDSEAPNHRSPSDRSIAPAPAPGFEANVLLATPAGMPRSGPGHPLVLERASPSAPPSRRAAPSNGFGERGAAPASHGERVAGATGRGSPRGGDGAIANDEAPPSTGLLGPAALDTPNGLEALSTGRPSPESDPSRDLLGISFDDSRELRKIDVVERFERQQRLHRTWGLAITLVVLGASGGVALAKFGPSGNPLQILAERYGLLQPKIADDGASRHIEEAHHAFDLDTLDSLEKAEKLLELAESLRHRDASLPADRALVLITRADALRRSVTDMTTALPAAANGENSTELEKGLKEKGELASRLLKRAFDLAKSSYQRAPEGFEPVRALAEYYRVQRDAVSFEREITRGKAMVEKSGATDPAILYIEAASLMNLGAPAKDELEKARHLLGQALSIRPSMNRARVLLARIQIARAEMEDAQAELERVLSRAPGHAEARALKALADRRIEEKRSDASAQSAPPSTTGPSAPSEANGEKTPPPQAGDGPEEPGGSGDGQPVADGDDGRTKAFESLMVQGDRHRERDRPKKALQAYEKAADLRPGSAEPLTGMGWSYIDLDKPEAALNVFRRALHVNDRYVEAYYGQAESYRLLGQQEQAIESYEKYLSRAPNGSDRKAAERALEALRNK